jgi:hypothetical protein
LAGRLKPPACFLRTKPSSANEDTEATFAAFLCLEYRQVVANFQLQATVATEESLPMRTRKREKPP